MKQTERAVAANLGACEDSGEKLGLEFGLDVIAMAAIPRVQHGIVNGFVTVLARSKSGLRSPVRHSQQCLGTKLRTLRV